MPVVEKVKVDSIFSHSYLFFDSLHAFFKEISQLTILNG